MLAFAPVQRGWHAVRRLAWAAALAEERGLFTTGEGVYNLHVVKIYRLKSSLGIYYNTAGNRKKMRLS